MYLFLLSWQQCMWEELAVASNILDSPEVIIYIYLFIYIYIVTPLVYIVISSVEKIYNVICSFNYLRIFIHVYLVIHFLLSKQMQIKVADENLLVYWQLSEDNWNTRLLFGTNYIQVFIANLKSGHLTPKQNEQIHK